MEIRVSGCIGWQHKQLLQTIASKSDAPLASGMWYHVYGGWGKMKNIIVLVGGGIKPTINLVGTCVLPASYAGMCCKQCNATKISTMQVY